MKGGVTQCLLGFNPAAQISKETWHGSTGCFQQALYYIVFGISGGHGAGQCNKGEAWVVARGAIQKFPPLRAKKFHFNL